MSTPGSVCTYVQTKITNADVTHITPFRRILQVPAGSMEVWWCIPADAGWAKLQSWRCSRAREVPQERGASGIHPCALALYPERTVSKTPALALCCQLNSQERWSRQFRNTDFESGHYAETCCLRTY